MRYLFMRLVLAVRRARFRLLIASCVAVVTLMGTFWWMHNTYPKIAADAKHEEVAFWQMADALSLEDRAALLNHSLKTNELPRLLPWWEYDRHMCSAVVVKNIALYTGIKLVHGSAWQLRTARACSNCVGNERKLTTVWDATEQFASDGSLTQDQLENLTHEVKGLEYDPDKVYVMGLLWTQTHYWEKIAADQADINSHVALFIRGRIIQFIDMDDGEDPLKFGTLDELFVGGDLKPVWIAEVHEKTQASKQTGWKLVKTDFRLPRTERELTFAQQIWPWKSLRRFLVFPSRPWYAPDTWHSFFQQADTLVEKSLLYRWRNGYDSYPTSFTEVR